jgi:CheY-like chemotaxis protein
VTKLNILMIDDDPLIHSSCRMMLFGSKHNQISIQDPDEALRYPACKDNYDKPNIIFVDLMMDNVNGLDVIREMRKDIYFDKIPVLLHTGYASEVMGTPVLHELGIVHVLPKPCTKAQFLKCIDTYVDYFAEDKQPN